METGHLLVPIRTPFDITDPRIRSEMAEAARGQGATLTGDPEVVHSDQYDTENVPLWARVADMAVLRWEMTRPAKVDTDG